MSNLKLYWKHILLVLTLAYISGAAVLIVDSKKSSVKAQEEKSKIAKILNFNDRLLNFQEWVSNEEWERKNEHYNNVLKKAEEYNKQALNKGLFLVYISIGFVVLVMIILYSSKPYFGGAFSLSVVALMLLIEGVVNPMLEVGAFKENLTVKAKVKPIETPAYHFGMDRVDNMNKELDFMVDSLDQTISDVTDAVHEKSQVVQNKLNDISAITKNIPFYGNNITEKINSISSFVDPLTEITHPLNSKLFQLKSLKDGMLDSLKSVSDLYAQETYGIDKVFQGRTYFYYQNKGVFDIIGILVEAKNYIVAVCIGLFSFIIPCIKLSASLLLLLFPSFATKKTQGILGFISKWSMADVFVVGAFLSYLSFSNMSPGVDVEANVVFGLFFFLAYVVISIFLGSILKKSICESNEIKDSKI